MIYYYFPPIPFIVLHPISLSTPYIFNVVAVIYNCVSSISTSLMCTEGNLLGHGQLVVSK